MIKLSDYVMNFIAKLGVKHIFMFSGGGAMHLVDSLGRNKQLEPVCVLHEQAASIAMESYSQYTENLGVSLVTTGPGGTNAVTGVAAAWIDSIPCMVISGQVKRADLRGKNGVRQMGGQEVDIVEIVDSITKYAVTVLEPASIRYHLEKAIYMAKTGRPGPVWIDIPLDVQAAMIEEDALEGFTPVTEEASSLLVEQVAKTLAMLNKAKRPVFLAGNGIRLASAGEEFLNLIDQLGIPVLTTWKAADFLAEDYPLFIGRPGAIGQRGANFAQQNADFIMTVGARLDLAQTGYDHSHFAPVAQKVFVDIDEAELKKMKTHIDVEICVDAKEFLKEMLRQMAVQGIGRLTVEPWLAQCKKWQKEYPVVLDSYLEKRVDGVDTYAFIQALSEVMAEGDILVPGSSGACAEITLQAFQVKAGQRIINSPGLGSMGFGLPAAIGVCLASGKKRVVCIDGDGGIQLNIQELETLQRLQLPVILFVLNNQGYGSIRNTQQNYFDGHFVGCDASSGLTLPSLEKLANVYGIASHIIVSQDGLRKKIQEVLHCAGPVICEIMTPVTQLTMPKLASKQNEDGSMESKPLEELWPFLEEAEVQKNTGYMREKEARQP